MYLLCFKLKVSTMNKLSCFKYYIKRLHSLEIFFINGANIWGWSPPCSFHLFQSHNTKHKNISITPNYSQSPLSNFKLTLTNIDNVKSLNLKLQSSTYKYYVVNFY